MTNREVFALAAYLLVFAFIVALSIRLLVMT